jgi:hypothetical protein
MLAALTAVSNMRSSLGRWATALARDPKDLDALRGYADSMLRKMRLLEHHASMFASIDWDTLSRLANGVNTDPTSGRRYPLPLVEAPRQGFSVYTDSFDAADLTIHAAFDGVVAACINSCDTLGRLVNLAYQLGMPVRRASLPAVATHLSPTCPLGVILKTSPGIGWMEPLRELRGECQHGILTEVMSHGVGAATEYVVAGRWHFPGLTSPKASAYVQESTGRTLELLACASTAIAADPAKATVL